MDRGTEVADVVAAIASQQDKAGWGDAREGGHMARAVLLSCLSVRMRRRKNTSYPRRI